MEKIFVFIGARGGSKGVKGKNIRPLLGKPLIAYTIQQALRWGKATRVVVSTDSEEIARIAKEYGAEVPFLRPPELATDTASKTLAMKYTVIACEKKFNEQYDIVVDLDVTAPVRTLHDLDGCLEMFRKFKPKSLFSVVGAHKNPYFNLVEDKGNGKIELCKKLGKEIIRRQDAPPVYAANASIYFYQRDYFVQSENPLPISEHTRIFIMDDSAGVDIDREIDFKFVEFLAKEGIVQLEV